MNTDNARRAYTVSLDLAEGRLVFEALAEQPFKRVYALIGHLNRQANELAAVAGDPAGTTRQTYRLDAAEFDLVLGALGELPFSRVHELLSRLTEQARGECLSPNPDAAANG